MKLCFQDTLVDASLKGKLQNVTKSFGPALELVLMISTLHFSLTQAQVIAFERGSIMIWVKPQSASSEERF